MTVSSFRDVIFSPHFLFRVSFTGARKSRPDEQTLPFYSIPIIGDAITENKDKGSTPPNDKNLQYVMDFINKHFRKIDIATLKVEIDPNYRAFKSQISPHYVCRTYNGYFFMNKDRMTVGSPEEIFKDDKDTADLLRLAILGTIK